MKKNGCTGKLLYLELDGTANKLRDIRALEKSKFEIVTPILCCRCRYSRHQTCQYTYLKTVTRQKGLVNCLRFSFFFTLTCPLILHKHFFFQKNLYLLSKTCLLSQRTTVFGIVNRVIDTGYLLRFVKRGTDHCNINKDEKGKYRCVVFY